MLSKVIVNSPWYFFLLSLLFGLVASLLLYYKNKKNTDVPKNVTKFLFVLRFLSVTLISLFLLSIFLKQLKNETQNPIILVALDNSSSMVMQKDSLEIKKEFLLKLEDLKKNISKNFEVRTLLFGNKTTSTKDAATFTEKETDISNLISEVENNFSNQNIGALVIISDGIYNKGSNPIYASEKLNFPVYPVAIGDTSEIKDLAIQKINHNQVAYLGNIFPAEVVVTAKNFAGKEVTVSLFQNQIEKAKQTLKINTDNFLATCNFTFNANTVGVSKYNVRVTVLEDEKNILNNQQSFLVDVIDNKEKILLLATAPHPDIAAIKDAITNSTSYEVEYALASEFKKPLKQYSLIILHGPLSNQNPIINDCKINAIPFWIINPLSAENLQGIKINSAINRFNDAEAFINTSFGLFTISDELKKFTKELPAIKTFFGNYSLGNGSNSLINQRIGIVETENPILIFSEINGLKNSIFIGDGLWKWKMRDFAEHTNHNLFNELISKSVQYLSVKSDKSFFRIIAPKTFNENENIEIGAEVYNKSYELITEPDVVLTLTNAEGKKYNYTFSKTSNAYKLNIGLLPFGEYKYEAKVKVNNELFVKQGSLLVKEIVSEKINTVANHQVLNAMAKRTGGKLFYKDQLELLEKEILKNEQIKPITYSQNNTTLLIDLKWLFWIILIFLSVEWYFRKRYASI
ncbi:MAG: VWA domain-containing protein [Bacteroidetes bacterium]|nr:VWA domain-containing protein [Bacteroidota bacterium]